MFCILPGSRYCGNEHFAHVLHFTRKSILGSEHFVPVVNTSYMFCILPGRQCRGSEHFVSAANSSYMLRIYQEIGITVANFPYMFCNMLGSRYCSREDLYMFCILITRKSILRYRTLTHFLHFIGMQYCGSEHFERALYFIRKSVMR